jgi:hypothetical protein
VVRLLILSVFSHNCKSQWYKIPPGSTESRLMYATFWVLPQIRHFRAQTRGCEIGARRVLDKPDPATIPESTKAGWVRRDV